MGGSFGLGAYWRYYGEFNLHFALKIKIYFWEQPRRLWVPYVSVALGGDYGFNFGGIGLFGDVKMGWTHYNAKRTFGVTPCFGISILGGYNYIPYGNVGVNFEFGCISGFRKRPRDN